VAVFAAVDAEESRKNCAAAVAQIWAERQLVDGFLARAAKFLTRELQF
jgi:hypothetical protein